MKYRIYLSSLILVFSLLSFTSHHSQSEWVFKKERDGIRVYTRDVQDSNLKELKITLQVEASMNSIVALIGDINAYQNWVYRCAKSKTLRQVSPTETIDYYIMDFPWPLSDRDMTVRSTFSQDPMSKAIISETISKNNVLQHSEEMVRIENHYNRWVFTPLSTNKVDVVYTLNSHPGGNIPDWLVNLAIDQGPMESMKRFRNMLKTKKYQLARVEGITNY